MNFSDALLDIIISSKKSAISKQSLYREFIKLWLDKKYKNIDISDLRYNSKDYRKKFKRVLKELETSDKLKCIGDEIVGASYFINLTISPLDPLKIISDLYSLGYFSHFSAMKIHKLVDGASDIVYFSTVDRKVWKKHFLDNLEKDKSTRFDNDEKDILDLIPRFPTEENYLSQYLLVFTNKNFGHWEIVNGLKVRKISFLFLDMVRSPQYCGGVETVISVFEKYAPILLEEIIETAHKYGTNIDRARIGFILDELMGLTHPMLEQWKIEMVGLRGGSRKFVAYLPFDPEFSPIWNISLNHDSVKNSFHGVFIKKISETDISNKAYFEIKFAYIHTFIEYAKKKNLNDVTLLIHNLRIDDIRNAHPYEFPYKGDRIYLKNEEELNIFLEKFKMRFERNGFTINPIISSSLGNYKYWQFKITWENTRTSLLETTLNSLEYSWAEEFIKEYLISRGATFK
ncbi:hypothetical protein C9E88_016700 (plasmid) [Acinetobacter cumulans]|uniref:hypothetical protein n=1 Tax=Acinetobacter cumulans TaxID=2136182 RepID=UPI000D13CB60|nr:hypothetical protein [Acinetobacter cumulans]QCO23153.1 hypothetical protein C9E88_016700 [Acinetobacter cumulans]